MIKLATYNIQYCMGLDEKIDPDRIADAVGGADILALQEVDRFWERSEDQDQVKELTRRLPHVHHVFAPGIDVHHPRLGRRQHGLMILSRWPILSHRTTPLPMRPHPDLFVGQSLLQEAVIATPEGALRLYNTHFNYGDEALIAEQAAFSAAVMHQALQAGGVWGGGNIGRDKSNGDDPPPMPETTVLVGDLNVGPTSDAYRILMRSGLVDPWVSLGQSEEGVTSSHLDDKRLDHVLCTEDCISDDAQMWIDTKAVGSDHMPVWLQFQPGAA